MKKNSKGTITAANSSSINDGASALLIVNEATIKKFNLKPIARIVGKEEHFLFVSFLQ